MKKLIILFTAILILLSGCNTKDNKNNSKQNNNASNSSAKNYKFIMVCPIVNNEYWLSCMEGMKQADELLGTKTTVIGPKSADNFSVEIIGYMQEAIAARPDGIILYSGLEALSAYIEQARELNIPVLSIDSDAPKSSRIAYVGSNSSTIGQEIGEFVASKIGGSKKIGIIVSSKQAVKEMDVVYAFMNSIHDYNIEVVTIEETDCIAEQKTVEMLAKYPEISAIFCTGAINITGTAYAKQKLGKKDLVIVGFDDTEENLRLVREGVIDLLVAQNIKQAGYQSVYLMKKYLDSGTLQKKYYDVGINKITIDNIDTYADAPILLSENVKNVRVGFYLGEEALQNVSENESRKTGYAYEYLQSIASVAGWDYTYTYGTRTEILDKLAAGKVDIVAGVYNTAEQRGKVLFSEMDMGLPGTPRYFAVNAMRADLLEDLNSAMNRLVSTTPNFTFNLTQKYYAPVVQQVLSDAEVEWLKNNQILRIGYLRHSLPMSDQDENGEPIGVVKDLIENIENFTHANLLPICFDTIAQMDAAIKINEIDTAFPMFLDLWVSETKGLLQTQSIITDRVMLLYDGAYTPDIMQRIAVSETNIGLKSYITINYPNTKLVMYGSVTDVIEAVVDGTEKSAIGCSCIFQRILKEHPEYDLNIAYLDSSENFGMTVKRGNGILLSILVKAIKQTGNAAITSSMIKYSEVRMPYSLKEFLRQNSTQVISILLAIFGILVFVFVSYIRKNREFKAAQKIAQSALETALQNEKYANEAKTTFLSSMSHDIRTPLNAIVGMTTIAQKNLDNIEKVSDSLSKIDLSSRHLLTLINNVLDISKIESGQLQLNPVVFSLKQTMIDLGHIVQPTIISKQLNFNVAISDFEHEFVYADEVRINQIFMNILTNAVKYTPDGGNITVSLLEEVVPDSDNVLITYTVSDTGIGMTPEFMADMYNTFSRAKDSRINKIQGTGLGLAIVKKMIDMMEGTIDCKSKEGEGTTFVIKLKIPIATEEMATEQSLVNIEQTTKATQTEKFIGLNILVAEDNELNWEVISDILGMYKINTERAENGEICVEKLSSAPPGTYDLILMDVQMPVLNGRDATIKIRKDSREYVKNIPIIAMTADAFAEDIKACLEVGMNGHISKPIDINKIFQEIGKALENNNNNNNNNN